MSSHPSIQNCEKDSFDSQQENIFCSGINIKSDSQGDLLIQLDYQNKMNIDYLKKGIKGIFNSGLPESLVQFLDNNQISIALQEQANDNKQLLWFTTIILGVIALHSKQELSNEIQKDINKNFLKELAKAFDVELKSVGVSNKEMNIVSDKSVLSSITQALMKKSITSSKLEIIKEIITEFLLNGILVDNKLADNFKDILRQIASNLSLVIYFVDESQTNPIFACGRNRNDNYGDDHDHSNPRVHLPFMVIIEKQENKHFEVILSDFSQVYQETNKYQNNIIQCRSSNQQGEIMEINDPFLGEVLFYSMQEILIAIREGKRRQQNIKSRYYNFFNKQMWEIVEQLDNQENDQKNHEDIHLSEDSLRCFLLEIKQQSQKGMNFILCLADYIKHVKDIGNYLKKLDSSFIQQFFGVSSINQSNLLRKELKERTFYIYLQPELLNLLSKDHKRNQNNNNNKNKSKNNNFQSKSSSDSFSNLCSCFSSCFKSSNTSKEPEEYLQKQLLANESFSSAQQDQQKKQDYSFFQYLFQSDIEEIEYEIRNTIEQFERSKLSKEKSTPAKQESLQKYVKPKSETFVLVCGPPRICHQCGGIATSSFKDISPICRQCLHKEWEELC